jgi:hypothetical protein
VDIEEGSDGKDNDGDNSTNSDETGDVIVVESGDELSDG